MIAIAEWIGALEANGIEGITLNLGRNRITAQGVSILVAALIQHPGVVHILGLAGNQVGDEGAMLIADAIGRLPLRVVILDATGMTGVGVQAVLTSVATSGNGIVQYLSMEGNNVQYDDEQTMELVAALQGGIVQDGVHV
jgi:Ran GTPase-activating protein (RanGAP) involved in mRNA processing and transport